jgi:hypothetical protein
MPSDGHCCCRSEVILLLLLLLLLLLTTLMSMTITTTLHTLQINPLNPHSTRALLAAANSRAEMLLPSSLPCEVKRLPRLCSNGISTTGNVIADCNRKALLDLDLTSLSQHQVTCDV